MPGHQIFLPLVNRNDPLPEVACTVPFFSQRDPNWRSVRLGSSHSGCKMENCNTIGNCGCTITSAAMVFKYYGVEITPERMNEDMGASACPFAWQVAESRCGEGKVRYEGKFVTSDIAKLLERAEHELNTRKRPPILKLAQKSSGLTHWVVIVSGSGSRPEDYIINDPWLSSGYTDLSARTHGGWELREIAMFNGVPVYNIPPSALDMKPFTPEPFLAAFNPPLAAQSSPLISVLQAQQITASPAVSGEISVVHMSSRRLTVEVSASSSAGKVTHIMLWTNEMRHTNWQAFSSFIELPLGDTIYARFKDEQGNVSLIQAETSGPAGSSPMDI